MTVSAALYRWDDLELEKVTEMVSRKAIGAPGQQMVQTYLKKGALVPRHEHAGAQWIYVLQGALDVVIAAQPAVTIREGEALWVPPRAIHQAEAIEDTFVLDVRG